MVTPEREFRLDPLPAFSDNYIWLLHDSAGRALAVDPGDADVLLAALEQRQLRLEAVLVTHHHPDHIGGLAAIRERFDVPVHAPRDPRIPFASHRVGDGDRVRAIDLEFAVISVPGHTSTHVAYHAPPWLFCGDTLFSLGCGRLFEGSPAQMLDSLDRLAALPEQTLVCCTHEYTLANGRFARVAEPVNSERDRYLLDCERRRLQGQPTLPSTMAIERACNPFLRCDHSALRDSVARHTGAYPPNRLDTFAELRRWKDRFS